MDYEEDIPPQRLRFDDLTRGRLLERLRKAIIKSGNNYDCDRRSELLVSIFEGFSESNISLSRYALERQDRRRERLASIASHIEAIQMQLSLLDDAAKEYTCFICFNELIRAENPNHKTPDTYNLEDMLASASLNELLPQLLRAYSSGIKEAERSLPFHSNNQSGKDLPWYKVKPQLALALALEKAFFDHRIKYSTTLTGLAAECLRAIYSHSSFEVDRVDYWLKQAKDHHDSMASVVKRHKRQDE